MNNRKLIKILFSIQLALITINSNAQDLYILKVETFPFDDGLVYHIKPTDISKIASLKIKLSRTPWIIEFEDFIDSINYAAKSGYKINPATLTNKDFRIRIIIRHKYLFFIKHRIYCDRFGFFIYKGRTFQSDALFNMIMECIPPYIDPSRL